MPPEVQAKLKSHPNVRHYLIYSNIQGIKGILAVKCDLHCYISSPIRPRLRKSSPPVDHRTIAIDNFLFGISSQDCHDAIHALRGFKIHRAAFQAWL